MHDYYLPYNGGAASKRSPEQRHGRRRLTDAAATPLSRTNSTVQKVIEGEKMSRRRVFSPRTRRRGRGGQWGDGGDELVGEDLTDQLQKISNPGEMRAPLEMPFDEDEEEDEARLPVAAICE